MDKKTLTYLAIGTVAGYAVCRMFSKHPVVAAAEAVDKAAAASEKAAVAATVAANAAGSLAATTAKGMGRRVSAPSSFLDHSRLLGIHKSQIHDGKLSAASQEFLRGLEIGGKRVHYDTDYGDVWSGQAGEPVDSAFSVYVGEENTPKARRAFDAYVNQAGVHLGQRPTTDLRSSWPLGRYVASHGGFGKAPLSAYEVWQRQQADARHAAHAERVAAAPLNIAN